MYSSPENNLPCYTLSRGLVDYVQKSKLNLTDSHLRSEDKVLYDNMHQLHSESLGLTCLCRYLCLGSVRAREGMKADCIEPTVERLFSLVPVVW
jgi:hypothetical protein